MLFRDEQLIVVPQLKVKKQEYWYTIMDQFFDVLIIGGGMAGVSTAFHLGYNKKFSGRVGLLEARNRWGGRIHGHELSSKRVELGANWIHGIIGNPICDIAIKNKLVDPLGAESCPSVDSVQRKKYFVTAVTQSGKRVPIKLVEDCYNTYFWFMKQCESYFNLVEDDSKSPPAIHKNSVGKHLMSDILSYLNKSDTNEKSTRKAIFINLLLREACISGSHSINDVSLKDFGAYEELPGGNLVIDGGYIRIIGILLNEIDNYIQERKDFKFEPYLDHEVSSIKWKTNDTKKSVVEVYCSNGSKFTCNHVVVTLPLGVLKESIAVAKSLFEPELPQYKIDCIINLGLSVVNKIFVEWRNKFPAEILDPSFANEYLLLWTDDDDNEERTCSSLADKDQTPEKWWKTIYSFSVISDRCLMGWLSGKEAELVELMDPVEVGRILNREIFQKFLHPKFPEPDSVLVTKWKSDPYSRGSYTFLTPNSSVEDIERLIQPIYSDPGNEKPTLMFAGEACHTSFFSTVHGAFLSGKKASSFLLNSE